MFNNGYKRGACEILGGYLKILDCIKRSHTMHENAAVLGGFNNRIELKT